MQHATQASSGAVPRSTQTLEPSIVLTPIARGDLSNEKIALIEEALSSGCTELQAAAVGGVPLREWECYAARRVAVEPDYLHDLRALSQRMEGLAVVTVARSLERGDDVRLALDVLGRRAPEWSSKGNLNVNGLLPPADIPEEQKLRLKQMLGLVEKAGPLIKSEPLAPLLEG